MIFYEAPHKLLRTLCDLRDTFGGARDDHALRAS